MNNKLIYFFFLIYINCGAPKVYVILGDDRCNDFTYGYFSNLHCDIEIKKESDNSTIEQFSIEDIELNIKNNQRLKSFQNKNILCFEIPHYLDKEFVTYDLKDKKVKFNIKVKKNLEDYFSNYSQEFNLLIEYEEEFKLIYFEDCSPSGKYVILDYGTSQNRTKFLISNNSFHVFQSNFSGFKWISEDSFEYWETPLKTEVSIPIEYFKDGNSNFPRLLQEKRIWENGKIIRTNETKYIDLEY